MSAGSGKQLGQSGMGALYATALGTLTKPGVRLAHELQVREHTKVYGNAYRNPETITEEMVWEFLKWSQARDTLVVWSVLAREIGAKKPPIIDRDDTLEIAKEKAAGFGKWMEGNREALAEVRELDLFRRQLLSLPPEIGQLKNLRELQLSNNRLTVLPPEIGQLERLSALSLMGNRLPFLPAEMGRLKSLEYLSVAFNKLRALPEWIGDLRGLKWLNVEGNELRSLPDEIGKLENLERLFLSHNKLTCLPQSVENLEKLVELDN